MPDLHMPDTWLATFVLVLARVSGLMATAPVLGHLSVPVRVRAGFAAVLAAALTPVVAVVPEPASLLAVGGMLVVEVTIGVVIGLAAQLILSGVQLGGQLAGIQMGFGIVNLIDPQTHAQVSVIAEWEQLLALLVFLVLDVHHLLLQALIGSFRSAPPGAVLVSATSLQGVVALASDLFVVGVRVAAPVLIAMLLTNGALGVLARTVPQLNVFVVGFPLNVGVGLVVLGASLPFTFRLLAARFAQLEPALGGFVGGLVHG
jgi:flagellar biosynthetic protein FliR